MTYFFTQIDGSAPDPPAAKTNELPFIDRHCVHVDASPDAVWVALAKVLPRTFGGKWSAWFARVLGSDHAAIEGVPLAPGSTVVGFRVAEMEPQRTVTLRGRHRFSRYALTFEFSNQKLCGTTHAEFPGFHGALYKTLVIGTRGHVLAVTRILTAVKRQAEKRAKDSG